MGRRRARDVLEPLVEQLRSPDGQPAGAFATQLRRGVEQSVRDALEGEREAEPVLSVEHHVLVQTALEGCVAWGLLPAVMIAEGASWAAWTPEARRELAQARGASKALRLGEEALCHGLCAPLPTARIGSEERRAVVDLLWRLARSPGYSHFVAERFLADVALARCAEGEPADVLMPELDVRARVGSLLRALRFVSRVTELCRRCGSEPPSAEIAARLGRQLSRNVAMPGGVHAVVSEMLGHVPHGNVNAFAKVSSLLLSRAEDLPAVSEQVAELIRACFRRPASEGSALFGRSMAMTANAIARRSPSRARELLLAPLLRALAPDTADGLPMEQERELLEALGMLHLVLDKAPPSAELLRATAPFMESAFEVYAFTLESGARGNGEARAVLSLWLQHASLSLASTMLRRVSARREPPGALGPLALSKSADGGLELLAHVAAPSAGLSAAASIQVREQESKAVEAEDRAVEEAGEDDEAPARGRVLAALRLATRDGIKATLFAACVASVAALLAREGSGEGVLGDLELLQQLLREEAQPGGFRLSSAFVRPESVVESARQLLAGCATALGLWAFEAGDAARAPSPESALALEIAPLAVAIAASLASHNANDELWAAPSAAAPPPSRFAALQCLLEPLAALSRLGGVAGAPGAAVVCHEVAESAVAVRLAVLAGDRAQQAAQDLRVQAELDAAGNGDEAGTGDIILDPVGKRITAATKLLAGKHAADVAMGLDQLKAVVMDGKTGAGARPTATHMARVHDLLLRTLAHPEPYAYLTCIRALGALCDASPGDMIPAMAAAFVDTARPLQVRLRLGEVLKLAAHRSGETLPRHSDQLIAAFCAGATRSAPRTASASARGVDEQGRYRPETVGEEDNDDGGDDQLLEEPFRTSCLANLAVVSALAPRAAFRHASRIVALAKGVLTFDLGPAQTSARRAAAYLLLQLVTGALALEGAEAIHEIPEDLKQAHRAVTAGSTYDKDRVVRLHCDRARAAFDTLVKRMLFPADKPKVLRVSLGMDRL